jgi:hypothetical protein
MDHSWYYISGSADFARFSAETGYFRHIMTQIKSDHPQLSAAMERALTLANTPLDVQITICMFLHPSDILALRKVCH